MKHTQLVGIAKMSQTSERVLRMVSERQRNTVYTAFSGLRADLKKRDGKEVERRDFDETFRALEKIGAGKLKYSKRGAMVGFQWAVPVREIARLMSSEVEAPPQVQEAMAAKTHAEEGKTEARGNQKVTVVILRKSGKPQTLQITEKRLRDLEL